MLEITFRNFVHSALRVNLGDKWLENHPVGWLRNEENETIRKAHVILTIIQENFENLVFFFCSKLAASRCALSKAHFIKH